MKREQRKTETEITAVEIFFKKNSKAVISVLAFRNSHFLENSTPPTVFKISRCGFLHSTHNQIVYKLLEKSVLTVCKQFRCK